MGQGSDMDRQEQLKSYSTAELVAELRRRKEELESGIALLAEPRDSSARNSKMSAAKAEYWKPWHDYKRSNPDATLAEWRRALKRGKK
jgi:hypothetical protein